MNRLLTLAEMLNIRLKLPDDNTRLLYLRDVWGMEQDDLATHLGKSQSYVSITLKKARAERGTTPIEIEWEPDELKLIQFAPRELFTDNEVAAFIIDILQLEVNHPFFNFHNYSESVRIPALHSLGIRQRRLMEMFNKKQSTLSMFLKGASVQNFERTGRYDKTANYTFKTRVKKTIHDKPKFIQAGGTNYIW